MGATDDYLADLARRLRLDPRSSNRLLEEVADHLHQASDEACSRGVDRDEAERTAVGRMGAATVVARAANGGLWGLARAGVRLGASLAAVGCGAIMGGAAVSLVLARLTSRSWVFAPTGSWQPSATVRAHVVRLHPTAPDWRAAATMENLDDTVVLRLLAAAVGLGVAGVVLVLTRRGPRLGAGAGDVLGAAALSVAAATLAAAAVTGSPVVDWGRGQAFADGVVALLVAIALTVRVGRRAAVRHQPTNRQKGWPAGSAST